MAEAKANKEAQVPDVILFGDDPRITTGFAKVMDHVVDTLIAMGHVPVVVGIKRANNIPYKCKVVNALAIGDNGGTDTLEILIRKTGVKVVFSVGDIWDVYKIAELKNNIGFVWVAYTPVESAPYSSHSLLSRGPNVYVDVAKTVKNIDHVVAYTDFGRFAIQDMSGVAPERVYHGVDLEYMHPVDKTAAKARVGVDKDVILFMALKSNSARAGFDTLLDAWQSYLAKCERMHTDLARRSHLYIHTNAQGNGFPLEFMIRDRNLEGTVSYPEKMMLGEGYPADSVRNFYQAADVFLSTTRGEGFGLNVLEAMACGTPAIVPDYAGPAEWGKGSLITVPIAAYYQPEFTDTRFAIVDDKKMADEMFKLANNPGKRREWGNKGRTRAEAFPWSAFEAAYQPIFDKAFKQAESIVPCPVRWIRA